MGYKLSKVYVGANQVRPGGWHPGTDTLGYYPLTSDYNNSQGTLGSITTTGTTSFVDDGIANIKVCQIASGAYLTVPNPTISISNGFTISLWTRAGSFGSYRPHFVRTRISNSSLADIQGYNGSGTILLYTDFPSYSTNYSATASSSSYDNWVITLGTSGTLCFWKNTSAIWSKSTGISADKTISQFYLGAGWEASGYIVYVSDVIIENKEWTTDDVNKYYNSTKSKYGR